MMKKVFNISKDALSDLFGLVLELISRLCKWYLKWYFSDQQ